MVAGPGACSPLGPILSRQWNHHVPLGGTPASLSVSTRIAEQVGFFTGLGVVIVFIAAAAFGRVMSLPSEAAPVTPVPAETQPTQPAGSSARPRLSRPQSNC